MGSGWQTVPVRIVGSRESRRCRKGRLWLDRVGQSVSRVSVCRLARLLIDWLDRAARGRDLTAGEACAPRITPPACGSRGSTIGCSNQSFVRAACLSRIREKSVTCKPHTLGGNVDDTAAVVALFYQSLRVRQLRYAVVKFRGIFPSNQALLYQVSHCFHAFYVSPIIHFGMFPT